MQQHSIASRAALEALAVTLARHTLPLSLKSNSNNAPWHKAERATLTLVSTGQRHVFVTCFHVLRRLEKMRRQDPAAQMAAYMGLNGCVAELTGFGLIDSDERLLDIAVFRGLEDKVSLPSSEFIDYSSSYLADPVPGDFVSIVGYPGANIIVSRNKGLFGFMHLGLPASSVSEKRIVLADEHGSREFVHYDDPAWRSISLGGLSGSPAFVHRDGQARFVGIVTDGSKKDQTVFVSRMGGINEDGTLNRTLIPC